VKLPAVVSADLRLNEPRYATLPNIMVSNISLQSLMTLLLLLIMLMMVMIIIINNNKK
jgi:hypothetical protein